MNIMKQLELFAEQETVVKEETVKKQSDMIIINGRIYGLVKKQGRPKGSKNKNKQVEGVTQVATNICEDIPTQKPVKILSDPIVELFVSPFINLNGTEYLGPCTVRQSIANELVYIMQQHQKREARVQIGTIHKIKNLGELA
jgi:hypothetical protein